MGWIRMICVVLILARAIYTDIKEGRIENTCILIGFVTAGGYSLLSGGSHAFFESMKMAVVILVALFFLFVLKGLGAGDIKLFCVLAVFYPRDAVGIVIGSFVVAAGIIVGKMLIRFLQKKYIYIPGETMNFSVPIGVATIMIEILQWI